MTGIHLCSFSAVDVPKGRALTYQALRASVLRAGRFSCFEATDTMQLARLYTRLCHDPAIETVDLGYPWTGVRGRVVVTKDPDAMPKRLSVADLIRRAGAIPGTAPVVQRVPTFSGDSTVALIHLGWRFNSRGGAMSLCRQNKTIKLDGRESWVLRWADVTCPRCRRDGLSVLAEEAEARRQGEP